MYFGMNTPLHNHFRICEAVDAAARDEIYRFRYRIYVRQMGLRQKYADHVRKRVVEVQKLIMMLEDEAWALSGAERCDIVETLVYFSDPDDLIPDDVEVIGLLDDAILLELLLQRMRHVRKAYAEFCAFRAALATDLRDAVERRSHARDLAALRMQLQARMRRGRLRAQASA
jgi:uncharacterized membrane protein YkvA (DUF1232 family)